MSVLTISLGVLAPALTVTMGTFQAWRVFRGEVQGVSSGTWLLTVVVAELWFGYGLVFHVPAEIAANGPSALLAGLIVWLAARMRRTLGQSSAKAVVLTVGATAVAVASVVLHAGWVLIVPADLGAFCLFLPQLAKVLREDDLVGVSTTTWMVGFVTSVAWGAYGLLIHQVPVWLPSTITIPSSIVIVVRVHRLRPAT